MSNHRDRNIEAALRAALDLPEVLDAARHLTDANAVAGGARAVLASAILEQLKQSRATIIRAGSPAETAGVVAKMDAGIQDTGAPILGLLASRDERLREIGIERVALAITHQLSKAAMMVVNGYHR